MPDGMHGQPYPAFYILPVEQLIAYRIYSPGADLHFHGDLSYPVPRRYTVIGKNDAVIAQNYARIKFFIDLIGTL